MLQTKGVSDVDLASGHFRFLPLRSTRRHPPDSAQCCINAIDACLGSTVVLKTIGEDNGFTHSR
jgi:hypothetical protein